MLDDVARRRRGRAVRVERVVEDAVRAQPAVHEHAHARELDARQPALEGGIETAPERLALERAEESDAVARRAVHAENGRVRYVVRGGEQRAVATDGDDERRVRRFEHRVRAPDEHHLRAGSSERLLDLVERPRMLAMRVDPARDDGRAAPEQELGARIPFVLDEALVGGALGDDDDARRAHGAPSG